MISQCQKVYLLTLFLLETFYHIFHDLARNFLIYSMLERFWIKYRLILMSFVRMSTYKADVKKYTF